MKYLKKYKHFENIEVSAKDEPDVKLAKEEANDLEEKLKANVNNASNSKEYCLPKTATGISCQAVNRILTK